jgi:hypothetical protein
MQRLASIASTVWIFEVFRFFGSKFQLLGTSPTFRELPITDFHSFLYSTEQEVEAAFICCGGANNSPNLFPGLSTGLPSFYFLFYAFPGPDRSPSSLASAINFPKCY